MTIQMKKDEFDGVLRIHSDQPLQLQTTVTVENLKGEVVQRFIVSRQSEFRGEYTYNFAKDRQSWLDKETEKREARRG